MTLKAYLLVKTVPGKEYEIAVKIKGHRGVHDVTVTYGLWDMVVEIRVENLYELDKLVTNIRSLEGIEQTTTLLGHKI